jgi:membrane associated rhomboid family serine protease
VRIQAWLAILIACVVFHLLQGLTPLFEYYLALQSPEAGPGFPPFRPWQLATHALLHRDWTHVFFNMFGLFMFGPELERLGGPRRFLVYFVVCVISGGLTQIVAFHVAGDPFWQAIGASGGIYGVLLAYGVAFPTRKVMLLIPPIPMQAWVLVLLFALFELFSGFYYYRESTVGHFAHLGGMIGGLLLIFVWLHWRRAARH